MINVKDEYKYIWNVIKDSFDEDLLEETKLNRQLEALHKWRIAGANGVIEAVTGFGKTLPLIMAIIKLNKASLHHTITVVVPTTNLKNDWLDKDQGHIVTFNLKNVEVFVVNSYTMKDEIRKCSLLGLDELHRYTKEDSEYFSTAIERTDYKFLMGLSATLESSDKKFLEKYNIPIIDTIGLSEANANGWVSNFSIFNIPCKLTGEDIEEKEKFDSMFKYYFNKFNFDSSMANACSVRNAQWYNHATLGSKTGKAWRTYYATLMGWQYFNGNNHEWSPKSIYKYASMWITTIRNRATFLHKASGKLVLAEKIIRKLNRKTILFCEHTETCNKLEEVLENSKACHSSIKTSIYKDKLLKEVVAISGEGKAKYLLLKDNKEYTYKEIKSIHKNAIRYSPAKLKDKIIKDFENNEIKYLLTAKAFNEGFDCKDIEVGIIHSGNSTKVNNIQRVGRVIRVHKDKNAIIVNIYVEDSQDEKWLINRQKGTPKSKINWVNSIDEIQFQEVEDIKL